jgi:large subunit ribosomal protein L18
MRSRSERTKVLRLRRHARVRRNVTGTGERPRLVVSRSHKNISAQMIDDSAGRTLVSASSVEPELRERLGREGGGNLSGADAVGRLLASRAKGAGITRVVFDRGGFAYHGRVAVLADAAREGGLEF